MPTLVEEQFAPLLGLPCWDLHWDSQTGLRLNFGEPHLEVRDPIAGTAPGQPGHPASLTYRNVLVRGEWVFWISGLWKLSLVDLPPTTGSSSRRRIQMGLARLEGQRLTGCEVNPHTGMTSMTFDLGGRLHVRRTSRQSEYGIWSLHMPGDHYLSVRGDGRYSLEPGDSRDIAWRAPIAEPNM